MHTDTHCMCLPRFTVAKEIFQSHNCSTLFSCRGAGISLWKGTALEVVGVCFTSWDLGGFQSGPSHCVCDSGGGAEPGKE